MAKTYIVAVYDCDREYGGPEEGGWYYNSGELVRVVRTFKNEDSAYEFCRRLNAKLKNRKIGPNVDRPHRMTSVLSEGEYWAEVHEDFAPKFYPEARPHYE